MKSKDWPKSSQIENTKYNEETETLEIKFKTGVIYAYYSVPKSVWAELLEAESIGKFVNSEIKQKYQFRKIN